MRYMAHATCHMSCAACHMSFTYIYNFSKWWNNSVGDLLSKGPTLSSLILSPEPVPEKWTGATLTHTPIEAFTWNKIQPYQTAWVQKWHFCIFLYLTSLNLLLCTVIECRVKVCKSDFIRTLSRGWVVFYMHHCDILCYHLLAEIEDLEIWGFTCLSDLQAWFQIS